MRGIETEGERGREMTIDDFSVKQQSLSVRGLSLITTLAAATDRDFNSRYLNFQQSA